VLRIDSAHGSALLTGDIEARSEAVLLRDGWNLHADLLVVPHHGSRTSSTDAFVEATHPKVAIFTVGYRNHFGHPRHDVVARYRSIGARLLRTDLTGAVTVAFDAEGAPEVVLERMRGRRYWYEVPVEE
jgi:competence protein ComEC